MKWRWETNARGVEELRIDGEIDTFWQEFNDGLDPDEYLKDLRESITAKGGRPITVWINSPGGAVDLGARIYTALKEYPGKVTVKIDGSAMSAASVIAMAGDEVLMSPPSLMMIHGAAVHAFGRVRDMEAAKDVLKACNDAMAGAYAAKSGLSMDEVHALMDAETWMSAQRAVELGFADGMLYMGERATAPAACMMTLKGVYAYSGGPPGQPPDDPEALERAEAMAAAREYLKGNK